MTMTMTRSKSMSIPTAYSRPEPAFEYKSSTLSDSVAPSSMPHGRLSSRVRLDSPLATMSRASASLDKAGGWSEGELRSTSMSHMKRGADCLVDVKTGLTGGSGSVEAKDANVGTDADCRRGSPARFPKWLFESVLGVTTIIGPRITLQCVTMSHR